MSAGPRRFSNRQLAEIFEQIASLLEIKGEVIYKTLAYRKAADSLRELSRSAFDLWQEGKLQEIPGVGKAIAEKIEELFASGKLGFLERLHAEVPPTLIELLSVPDLGPKKAALFWKQAGINSLAELEAAARAGLLRKLPGMGEKSEVKLIAGIEALKRSSGRTPLGKAWQFYQELAQTLRVAPGVQAFEAAGSLRRRRSTVGDLDILAAVTDSAALMHAFVSLPGVVRVVGHGETKSSVEFDNGLRVQVWAHPPERFGTALQYATGSKDHNVRLRELAQKQGLSLSEHALLRPDGSEILCAQEAEVYAALGLPWIPPELREDRGEISAALNGKLPKLLEDSDVRAALHNHTEWSDGRLSVRQLAEAAIVRGYKVLAITDHSAGLGVAGGLKIEDLQAQREEIRQAQAELGERILLLQGAEVEIRADGELDYPEHVLAELDIVIAALHVSLRQPREKVTQRMLQAITCPHVDFVAHPTGRMFPDREGADLDMEAVFQAAAQHGVALEINAHPARLDLDDVHVRRARELNIPITINTDSHSAEDLDLLHFGVGIGRRAWLQADDVINTWETERLQTWLQHRNV